MHRFIPHRITRSVVQCIIGLAVMRAQSRKAVGHDIAYLGHTGALKLLDWATTDTTN